MTAARAATTPPVARCLPGRLLDARALRALRLDDDDPNFAPNDSKLMIAGGLGLGVLAAIEIGILGVACPVCVVAAPILLATGVAQRLKWRRKKR